MEGHGGQPHDHPPVFSLLNKQKVSWIHTQVRVCVRVLDRVPLLSLLQTQTRHYMEHMKRAYLL